MARVSIARGSFLNLSLFDDVKHQGKFFSYFELPDYPDVPNQDDDILHVVQSSDRPDLLAYRFYGDQRLWWVICVKNGWDQPLTSMNPGEEITIPSPRWVRESLVR